MWRLEDELRGALLAINQMQGESLWVRRQISLDTRGGMRGERTLRQAHWRGRTDVARGVRQGRRPLVTPPSRRPLSPSDVERRQFVSTKTLRLRSALMALSGAASSVTIAPISVPILEHRTHLLRSNCAPRSSKTSASRPRTKPSAARASQGVPRCGRRSNGTFAIDWNTLCYGLSYKLDRSTPPSAAQPKTRVKSNSVRSSKCSRLELLSQDGFGRSPHPQSVADRLA